MISPIATYLGLSRPIMLALRTTKQLPLILQQVRHRPVYAVSVGRQPGIYSTWKECNDQVEGIANAEFQRFASEEEAEKYLQEAPKEDPIEGAPIIEKPTVYIGAKCYRNGTPDAVAGIGVHWPAYPERSLSEPISGNQTIVRAYIRAAIRAIHQARALHLRHLYVHTDNFYVVSSAVKFLPIWKQNDWKTVHGTTVKNLEDMKEFAKAIKSMKQVTWMLHKPENEPNETNVDRERADFLALAAVEKQRRDNK